MHQIHTTPGFIIDSRPYGEAGKILSVFTRDFGLVQATAQGIRLEKSKLRYHSQMYSLATFSLVRGKEFWRLTSAAPFRLRQLSLTRKLLGRPASPSGRKESLRYELIARLALLLRRLLHGEEARPEAFDALAGCLEFVSEHDDLDDQQLATLESLTVARILHWSGYIGDDKELNGHMKTFEITADLIEALKGKRSVFNQHINKALKESQM
jgi:recombinational DNA repair protein (RecF pathway)